ncbi:MAG: ypdA 15 [Herbinix sp.]|jgi:sensor histidine kinase YesM|nr:ypdA 15 [Herbinix sp.]
MERELVRKKQLKWRILLNISIVLAASMIISTITGYLYFEKVVREQKISDERVNLRQLSNQITFMTEDIENIARSIIVDEVLQKTLEKKPFEDEFQRVSNKDNIIKRLIFYNSLRTYIGSSFLELKDGERYSSSTNTMEEDYLNRKFAIEEFKQYNERADFVYSDPYYGLDTGKIQPVICYRAKMWNIHDFGSQQGTLYMEIYLDYFLKQIRTYGKVYENVCMLGNDNRILYEQDRDGKIRKYIEGGESINADGVYKVEGGYLICENINSTGWKLLILITNQYLWQRSSYVFEFFLISFLFSMVLIVVSTSRIMENMIQPITRLSEQMEKMDYNNLDTEEMIHTGDEIQTLYECFKKLLTEIRRDIDERILYEKHMKEMEFDIMLSQINPHYLYNVLNTVVYLAAAEKNERIVKIGTSLIYTLQETLNVGEHNIDITIEKELELTDRYITIQEYRYPGTFQVELECEDRLKQYLIPKTIIQPLVENAILHGILPLDRSGVINIIITEKDDLLYIIVKDNGIGIDDESLRRFEESETIVYEQNGRKHIGISNIRDRIRYLYGEPYGMKIQRRTSGGTKIELHLPVIKEAKKL